MKRLDFVLPNFVRLNWVSQHAKEVWEPRFKRIMTAWLKIEWLSVVAGIRSCSVIIVSPDEFVTQAREWVEQGIHALPVEIQALSNYTANTETDLAKPLVIRIVVGTPQNVLDFKHAMDACDDQEIARLLGTPSCCYEFFRDVMDTTWPMALATAESLEVTHDPRA